MFAKLTMPLAFLAAFGCARSAPPAQEPARALAAPSAPAAASEPEGPAPQPAEALTQADQIYDSQLGASRAGQFEVDRQVTELRRAVLLYRQFIERADGQPDFSAALRKSRERIDDACQTIGFLLAGAADQPPPASPGC